MTSNDPVFADEHTSKLLARAMLGRTFHDCPVDVIDRILDAGTLRTYAAGEYVVRRGTHATNFLLVVRGELEHSATYVSGHRHLFGFLRQGDCSGIISLMDGGEHIVDHIARVPTVLLAIPNAAIMREMQDQPQLCLALLRQLAPRTRIKYSRVTLDPGVPLPIRLAWALQTMATLYGLRRGEKIVLDVKLSQGDIADWLGVSRQHLNPHLKQLEKDGIICLGRSSLTILDPDRLARIAAS
ncbi:Crp/Fnr family transcriptional regulator [Cupriavidus sp. WKF15]|uniref:Crp/Fnr family transcriptional regulator n=1 Tax=Cupriavidus sp. WKF15 TaxID=3032282 RepID=UPI0023E21141|nr:Crp/Fnr family transcriptional regulator [Cupriavidus sp. WKF15]WER46579.1 Crp/Fnr family transcriptional regulator [Cupriavidus sp. WKF15]